MSNQKYYQDTGGNRVWVPRMGSIWHVRGNDVLHDYGDTRVSEQDYGNGLAEALGASGPSVFTAGDSIVVGPGRFALDNTTCAVPNTDLLFHRTELIPVNTAYDIILSLSADRIVCEGLRTNGASVAGSGDACGLRIQGNNVTVRNCKGSNHAGGTSVQGYAFFITGSDVHIENCGGENNQYTAIRGAAANRITILGGKYINNGTGATANRAIQLEGNSFVDWIKLLGVTTYAGVSGTGALINFGNAGGTGKLYMCGCSIINDNQEGSGNSYNTANREQCMKLQDIQHVHLENNIFQHGANANPAGNVTGFAMDLPLSGLPLKTLKVIGNYFSDGFQLPGLQRWDDSIIVEKNTFGIDRCEVQPAGYIFQVPNAQLVRFEKNSFNVHAGRPFSVTSSVANVGDRFELINNRIYGNRSGSHINIADDPNGSGGGPALLKNGWNVLSSGNYGSNADPTFDFRFSDWELDGDENLNLLLQQRGDGAMLFDDTKIGSGPTQGMPDPGTSPPYFPTLPGRKTQQVLNVNWTPEGTSTRPERVWLYTTDWQLDGLQPPFAGEMYLAVSGATQAISTTAAPVNVMDTSDIADGINVTPASAELGITEAGRYVFFFSANLESSLGKAAIFILFEQDGVQIDVSYRGYTRDAGESISLAATALIDVTQAQIDAGLGESVMQMLIQAGSGTPTITYYNCAMGAYRLH